MVGDISTLTGLHANIIAPLHILDQPHSTGLFIAPSRGTTGSVNEGSNGLIPLPAVIDGISFKVVSTWEAEEFLLGQYKYVPI